MIFMLQCSTIPLVLRACERPLQYTSEFRWMRIQSSKNLLFFLTELARDPMSHRLKYKRHLGAHRAGYDDKGVESAAEEVSAAFLCAPPGRLPQRSGCPSAARPSCSGQRRQPGSHSERRLHWKAFRLHSPYPEPVYPAAGSTSAERGARSHCACGSGHHRLWLTRSSTAAGPCRTQQRCSSESMTCFYSWLSCGWYVDIRSGVLHKVSRDRRILCRHESR